MKSKTLHYDVPFLTGKRILTADQAAEYLCLAKSYLYKLTSAGVLPFSKPGGKKIYFLVDDLEKWAMSNRTPGANERAELATTYLATKKTGR